MIIYNIEQRSEAWFDIRAGRITGTRFKFLMMGEKTKGYQDLISDIIGEILTGNIEPTYTNETMQRGIDLEPEAADWYNENICYVHEAGFVIPDDDHKFHEWVGVSPDRLITDSDTNKYKKPFIKDLYNGILEIKCPLVKTHLSYIEANVLPDEYKYQVQGQLYVTGLKYCDFMSYYPGLKPFLIRVGPDKEIFAEFDRRLEKFIEAVNFKIEKYKEYNYY